MADVAVAYNFDDLLDRKVGGAEIAAGVFKLFVVDNRRKALIQMGFDDSRHIAGGVVEMLCHRGPKGLVLSTRTKPKKMFSSRGAT